MRYSVDHIGLGLESWGSHSHVHFNFQSRKLKDIVSPQGCNCLGKEGYYNSSNPYYTFPYLSVIINPLDEVFDELRVGNCGQKVDEVVKEPLNKVAELVLVDETKEVIGIGVFVGLHKFVEALITTLIGI